MQARPQASPPHRLQSGGHLSSWTRHPVWGHGMHRQQQGYRNGRPIELTFVRERYDLFPFKPEECRSLAGPTTWTKSTNGYLCGGYYIYCFLPFILFYRTLSLELIRSILSHRGRWDHKILSSGFKTAWQLVSHLDVVLPSLLSCSSGSFTLTSWIHIWYKAFIV